MDISKFTQVPKELVNDTAIKASLYGQMTSNLKIAPSFYWKKFTVWKKYFKKFNPSLVQYSSNEREKIYKVMYKDFCEKIN